MQLMRRNTAEVNGKKLISHHFVKFLMYLYVKGLTYGRKKKEVFCR